MDRKKNITKILTFYTGNNYRNINDIIKDKTAQDTLWLEILVNDNIAWKEYLHYPIVRKNYNKACKWYNNFKTLLEIFAVRTQPLTPVSGKVDMKEYRKLIEVLYYVHQFKKNYKDS